MSFRRHAVTARSQGFSLLTVLAALAVMSLLLLALMSGAAHQVRGGQNAASLARARMLADSAVSLVIGQIQQATTQTDQAWISQPGLIRTYAATKARTASASYKLYSAPQMIDTSGGLTFLAGDVPSDWNSTTNASVYTDLNAPVQPLFGDPIYPILNANALSEIPGLSSDNGGVQMPVAWIYELRDGTLGQPSAATANNPIVGRIAFWTDDETSKIDINTAGEGSPWNTPRSNSTDDTAWSTMQPASGEFERYPGHPGGVSLGLLFGAGTTADLTSNQLLTLTPRYNAGGSDYGTQATTSASTVTPKLDRLYDSVDELAFGTSFSETGQRLANPVTPAELNLARFVLTAHSHSPETTLLGEPRVAIWPVSDTPDDSTYTTATDRAVENDATVGTGRAPCPTSSSATTRPVRPTISIRRSFPPTPRFSTIWSRQEMKRCPGTARRFCRNIPAPSGRNWCWKRSMQFAASTRSIRRQARFPPPRVSRLMPPAIRPAWAAASSFR